MEIYETAERFARGQRFFEAKQYIAAARVLAAVVAEVPADVAPRLLLARAYYHSAQLGRAETELREVLERDPAADYAHLVLGRTLQRQNRFAEAAGHLRLAEAMTGGSGV